MENTACSGKFVKGYSSLYEAKQDCYMEGQCKGVFDVGCNGDLFWTCEGSFEFASHERRQKMCSWVKRTDRKSRYL